MGAKKTLTKKKQVKVRHAHTKPYRRRHIASLLFFTLLGIGLVVSIGLAAQESSLNQRGARYTISDLFGVNTTQKTKITSSFGFSFAYDGARYRASAIDSLNNELYTDTELSQRRAYTTIRLSSAVRDTSLETSAVKLRYYDTQAATETTELGTLENTYVRELLGANNHLTPVRSDTKEFGGAKFLQTQWQGEVKAKNISLKASFVSFVAVVQNHPLVVIINQSSMDDAQEVMSGFALEKVVSAVSSSTSNRQINSSVSTTFFDPVLGITPAHAASVQTASERVSALYGPAVVKIYNIAKTDIAFDNQVILQNNLIGATGSGFIVSSNGFVATNGHVVVNNPREMLVMSAIENANNNNFEPLVILASIAGVSQTELSQYTDFDRQVELILDRVYKLAENRFTKQNTSQALLVGLNDEQADVEDIINHVMAGREYKGNEALISSKLIGSDFEGFILPSLKGTFSKSDVALLKMPDGDYPVAKLGSTDDVSQGSNLNILGYPAIGASNGLVSETQTSSSLTTGKVSSLKTDTGGRVLLETDANIGHGNSGGPAFDDDGNVVGLATYTMVGQSGDGVLNYVRDIKDLIDLADKSSVDYTPGKTQTAWSQGIEWFYQARYKKALASFKAVKELYPVHPSVTRMIAAAEKKIANGENIDDAPNGVIAVLAVIVICGIAGSIVLILRHSHRHAVLQQAVASGAVPPPQPGAPAQYIPVAPSAMTAPAAPATPTIQPPAQSSFASPIPQPMQPSTTVNDITPPSAQQPQRGMLIEPPSPQNPPKSDTLL